MGPNSLPGYGPVSQVNRPVRTRTPGGVGAGGEKPPATRLSRAYRSVLKRSPKLEIPNSHPSKASS